jgi:putative phosphoribosyl transferase
MFMTLPFKNRREAGQKLAAILASYKKAKNTLVLALPRGGVPVALEIAQILEIPLDVLMVRKLGAPGQQELAIGAIAGNGERVLNQALIQELSLSDDDISTIETREQKELVRRILRYRGDRPEPDIQGKCVILIDDGMATGARMLAAIAAVSANGANKVVADDIFLSCNAQAFRGHWLLV